MKRAMISFLLAASAVSGAQNPSFPPTEEGTVLTGDLRTSLFHQARVALENQGLPSSWMDDVIQEPPGVTFSLEALKDEKGRVANQAVYQPGGQGPWGSRPDGNTIYLKPGIYPLALTTDEINSVAHESWHAWLDMHPTWPFSTVARFSDAEDEAVGGFIGELAAGSRLSRAVVAGITEARDREGTAQDAVNAIVAVERHFQGEGSFFVNGLRDEKDVEDWAFWRRRVPEMEALEYYLSEEDRERIETEVAEQERQAAENEAFHQSQSAEKSSTTEKIGPPEETETEIGTRPRTGDVVPPKPGIKVSPGDTEEEDLEKKGVVRGAEIKTVIPDIRFTFGERQRKITKKKPEIIPAPDPHVFVRWSGGRDPSIQLMVLATSGTRERRTIVVPGNGNARRTPPARRRPLLASVSALVHRGFMWPEARLSLRSPVLLAPSQGSPLKMFLVSSGKSSGEGFEAHFINSGPNPVRVELEGLVVEPLKKKAQKEIQKQLRKLAQKNPVTEKINAYCLEFLRRPPSSGMMFRVADAELQQKYAPMRHVLAATSPSGGAGLLNPDSDPTEYLHSIRQWAIWTKERNFDIDSFGDAFVDRVKGNFEAASRPWNEQIEQAVRGLVPNRWGDIERVLKAVPESGDGR